MRPEDIAAWLPYFRYAVAIGLICVLVFTGHLDINAGLGAVVGLMFPLAHATGGFVNGGVQTRPAS